MLPGDQRGQHRDCRLADLEFRSMGDFPSIHLIELGLPETLHCHFGSRDVADGLLALHKMGTVVLKLH